MQFDSATYLFFLLLVVGSFWALVSHRVARTVLLLVASYLFYMTWSATFIVLIIGSTLLDFYVGRKIHESQSDRSRRLLLTVSMVGNLGLLGFFKYYNFFAENLVSLFSELGGNPVDYDPLNILLPVGISFYTFQSMSYTIDIYRRRLEPTGSLLEFALFVAFFPQLVAGPIVRARTFLPQLKHPPRYAPRRINHGLFLIAIGLSKKVLFADGLGLFVVDRVFRRPELYGSVDSLMAAYGYSFQIYFDFSAYSDIAIGSAALMGLRLPVNFRHPFLATDPSDLWRRWHISLSSWLRDYLYVPLGGNRKGRLRTQVNLLVTMVLGGLWHGAAWTFVFWGTLHGMYLFVHRAIVHALPKDRGPRALPRWLKIACMFHLTVLAFVFFRASSMPQAYTVLGGIFSGAGDRVLRHREILLPAMALVFAGHLTSLRWLPKVEHGYQRLPEFVQAVVLVLLAGLLGLCSYGQRPFIYFQF